MKRLSQLAIAVVVMVCLCGCSDIFGGGKPTPTPTMDIATVQAKMLEHLQQKYGESFICLNIVKSPDHSIFEHPNVFTMSARVDNPAEDQGTFTVQHQTT